MHRQAREKRKGQRKIRCVYKALVVFHRLSGLFPAAPVGSAAIHNAKTGCNGWTDAPRLYHAGRIFRDTSIASRNPDAGCHAAKARDGQLTKPPGALGRLEDLAAWYCGWRGDARPMIDAPQVIIFAGKSWGDGAGCFGLSTRSDRADGGQLRGWRGRCEPIGQGCRRADECACPGA